MDITLNKSEKLITVSRVVFVIDNCRYVVTQTAKQSLLINKIEEKGTNQTAVYPLGQNSIEVK